MISVYGKTGDFVNIPSLKIPKKDGFFVSWEIAPFDLGVSCCLNTGKTAIGKQPGAVTCRFFEKMSKEMTCQFNICRNQAKFEPLLSEKDLVRSFP